MIDLSLFFTPTVQGAKPQGLLTANAAQQGLGLVEAGAGNFMDMFLAGLTVDGEKKTETTSTVFLTKKALEQTNDKTTVDVQSLLDSLTQEQIDQHGDPLFSLPPEILALLKDDGVVEDSGDVKTGLLDLLHQMAAQSKVLEGISKQEQNAETKNDGQDVSNPISSVAAHAPTSVEKFLAALSLTIKENQSVNGALDQPAAPQVVLADNQGAKKKPDLSWIDLISLEQKDTPELQQIPFDSLPVEAQKTIITKLGDFFKTLLAGTPQDKTANVDVATLLVAAPDRSIVPPQSENDLNLFIVQVPKETVFDQSPTLIATNLTPQKLAEAIDALVKKFTENKQADRSETSTDQTNPLLALLAQILPPPQKGEILSRSTETTLSAGIPQPKDITNLGNANASETMDALAARLNDLVVGSDSETAEVSPALEQKDSPLRGFAKVLEMLEHSAGRTDTPPQGLENAVDHIKTHVIDSSNMPKQSNAGQNVLSTSMLQQASLTSDNNAAPLPQQIGFTTAPLMGATPAANLMLQAPQAGLPHPATQMVAATIAKNAKDGESKAMTLHLDPPELGRLQIKMEFGRDKTIKAHLVIEKPETYMMLQRDAQVLERTLQQSGFDVDSGSVSFELSQGGGNLFDHNDRNQGNGNTYGGGQTAFDDDGVEIIETTVNWQVDSATGQTRYDLWA